MKKLLSIIIILSACNTKKTPPELVKLSGKTFGTYYSIQYYTPDGVNYQEEIDSLLEDLDNSLSIYNKASLISKINNADTHFIEIDTYLKKVITKATVVSEKTNGAFDITIGPLANAWGFGFKNKEQITNALIDSLLHLIGTEKLQMEGMKVKKNNPNITIDVNAIAKGYGVDVIANFLKGKGVESLLVEIGGEVVALGKKPNNANWKIGIEKPAENKIANREIEAIVKLKDMAVASSGNYRNYYIKDGIKYAHTINPKTGYPIKHSLLSATVFANDCLTADAYATAFMVLGLEKSKALVESNDSLEAYFIYSDSAGYGTYSSDKVKTMLEE